MDLSLKLILVLAISACAYAGEGQMMGMMDSSGNMAGGSSKPGMYPWVARIEVGGVLKCHGSLINESYVLTAKNCVRKGLDYRNVSVLLGQFDLDNVTAALQNISVETCQEIEGVVLIELAAPADVRHPFVGVIPLATADQVSKITKKHKCFESGFGAITPGQVATQLQTVQLKLEANKKCNKKIKSGFDSTKELCFKVKKSGPCMQDIGTAVVCHENAGKNPGDVFQVAVEMMKSDKSPTKKKCYGGSYLAPIQTGTIRDELVEVMGGGNDNDTDGGGGEDDCPARYKITDGHTRCIESSDKLIQGGLELGGGTKQSIVDYHNDVRRNRIPVPATNMEIMSWSDEIAMTAQKWAENCEFDHDDNYKRQEFGMFSVGQNLATGSWKMGWATAMKLWADEVKDFNYGQNPSGVVGHYTQMVWATTSKVGCGYAECTDRHLYVCNYAPGGNNNFKTPYKTGTSCDDCQTKCTNGLCDCAGALDVCYNGGTKDLNACTCSCGQAHLVQPKCALSCASNTDISACGTSWDKSYCAIYSNVPTACPWMCGLCPDAETA